MTWWQGLPIGFVCGVWCGVWGVVLFTKGSLEAIEMKTWISLMWCAIFGVLLGAALSGCGGLSIDAYAPPERGQVIVASFSIPVERPGNLEQCCVSRYDTDEDGSPVYYCSCWNAVDRPGVCPKDC